MKSWNSPASLHSLFWLVAAVRDFDFWVVERDGDEREREREERERLVERREGRMVLRRVVSWV